MRAAARPLVYFPFLTFLIFILSFLAFISHYYTTSVTDPTSLFFDPIRGHERHYSLQRQNEAELYLGNLNLSALSDSRETVPRMCIGIPTVARDGEQYIRTTIASLLAGLTPTERREIFLVVLIAHTFPHSHPIFHETWLETAVDKVLFYNVSQHQTNTLTVWEKQKEFAKKGIFDYVYTLRHCLATGAQWITLVEDDTLAADGWYFHAVQALEEAEDRHTADPRPDWLYLRLFFTEEFLGWNIEELPKYLVSSFSIMLIAAVSIILIRQCTLSRYLTNSLILTITLIYVPALITLYFAAGRLTVQPLVAGLREMPKYGCCAQGLVFPREMATRVATYLENMGEGFVDELLEAWANEEGFVRWATCQVSCSTSADIAAKAMISAPKPSGDRALRRRYGALVLRSCGIQRGWGRNTK